jgi:Ca2+-dependent lipid-binding protein
VNGVEKAKTSVIKKQTNPKYEEPTEVVVLDKERYFLRAEVRDAANADQLLGVFTSYLKDMARLQESNESWWDLLNGEEKSGELRLSAEWKPVAMSGVSDYAGGHGFEGEYFLRF